MSYLLVVVLVAAQLMTPGWAGDEACEAKLLGNHVFHAKLAWRDTVSLFKAGQLGDGKRPFADELQKGGRFFEWTTLHPQRRTIDEIPGFISNNRLEYLIRTNQVSKQLSMTGVQFEISSRASNKIREHIVKGERVTEEFLKDEIDPIFLSWKPASD